MALAAGTNFEFRAGATAGMLNGGGFNPGATFGITDATTDANTANTASPIVSSATYNFVAADVNAWLFVKSGTNWIPGYYQITAVTSNKATLNGTIGQAVILDAMNRYNTPSTVVGCASVGTPTGGTIGVDYSQQNAADATATDYASAISSTTLTSATAGFRLTHIGNFFHLTTTGVGGFGLVGWYEIATYTSATQVTTDRTTNNGTALAGGTGYVGGALDLTGSLCDSLFEASVAGNTIFFKNGAFTLGSSVAVASASATATLKIGLVGYNTVRGDNPATANQPVTSCGANSFTCSSNWFSQNLIWTGTATIVLATSSNHMMMNCKVTNSSPTAARTAVSLSATSGIMLLGNEFVSQMGQAVNSSGSVAGVHGNYIHDSDIGYSASAVIQQLTYNIFESNKTAGFSTAATDIRSDIINNTFYGSEAKFGGGVTTTGATGSNLYIYNNIFYGLATGILIGTVQQDSIVGDYNDYFNNTTDRTRMAQGLHSLALNPTFTGASQLTGATATTSGSVLTQAGGDFSSVTDNVDYCHILSGTGATVGCYLITAHTATTITLNNAPGTNATADKVWFVGVGHNFAIGTNLKGAAFPGVFLNSETTGYLDMGAVQRQESAAVATTAFTFVG